MNRALPPEQRPEQPIHVRVSETLHGITVDVAVRVHADACARLGNGMPDAHQLLAINADLHTVLLDVASNLRGEVWNKVDEATSPDPATPDQEVGVYWFGPHSGDKIALLACNGRFPLGAHVTAPGVDQWSPPVVAEVVFCGVRAASDGTGRIWYVLRDLRHTEPGALLCETQLQPADGAEPAAAAPGAALAFSAGHP